MISFIHVAGRIRPWQLFEPDPVFSEGGPEYDPDWLAKMRKQRNAVVIPAADWLTDWTTRNGTDPTPHELDYCSASPTLDKNFSLIESDWVECVNGGTWGLAVTEHEWWSDSLGHDYDNTRTLTGTTTTIFGCTVSIYADNYLLRLQFVKSGTSFACWFRIDGPLVKTDDPHYGTARINTPDGHYVDFDASGIPPADHTGHAGFQYHCEVAFGLTFTPHPLP